MAYGSTAPNTNPDGDGIVDTLDLRFPGQLADAESGLFYNINRYYDPVTARYTQSDPIGVLRDFSDPQLQVAIQIGLLKTTENADELSNHHYSYVGSKPLLWYDPYGLAEHTKNSRPSNLEKHEKADARRDRDQGGEKGDSRRKPPRNRPPGYKGPWPPNPSLCPPLIVIPISPEVLEKILPGLPPLDDGA